MKDLVKKYWWVAILVLVLPIVINFTLQIPTFTPIVGDSELWLSFWGGYLGAILSASVAFIILAIQYRQNKEENQNNRQLQINVIKHQQEQARLQNIINVSAKLISDTELAKIAIICGKIGESKFDAVGMLDDIIKNIDYHKNEFDLYIDLDSKVSNMKFKSELDEHLFMFSLALNDITNVTHLFIINNGNVDISTLKKYLSVCVSEEMKVLVSNYADSVGHALDFRHCRNIITQKLDLMIETQPNISSCIHNYISAEKVRIDRILTEASSN